ncbi:MAG: VPLPA-CTERM sorting domain-containing protein [Roseicyclus sp.]
MNFPEMQGSGPTGGFGAYDVMVVGSTCNFSGSGSCAGSGFFNNGVFVDGLITLEAEIAAARGSRTFLSGQDADWHDLNNRQNQDDGPKGFMINAVNWAASGTGLGIVSMTDRIGNNNGWWTATGSFLAAELAGTPFDYTSNTVTIGAGQGSFPINKGLTSEGLSNWGTSSHACFGEVSGYTRINFAPFGGDQCGVTIVTSGLEDGGTSGGDEDPVGDAPVVPLPAGVWLLLSGLGAFAVAGRRRARG